MSRLSLTAFAAVSLIATQAWAQFDAKPAPELEKYAPMLGSWSGEGSVYMEQDSDPMPWSGKVRFQKALKDFVIREDLTIDVGGGMKISMLNFHVWDKTEDQFKWMGTSSQGGVHSGPVDWVSKKKMVTMTTMRMPNQMTGAIERVLERWTTTVNADGTEYEVLSERAVDDGPWFKHVTGTFKKSKTDVGVVDANTKAMAPAPEQMSVLAKMRGHYDVEGTMSWAPGADASMPIKGHERMDMIFDGQVLSMRTVGEPGAGMPADLQYEGLAYTSWDPIDKCYVTMYVSNMGEFGTHKMYPTKDNSFVILWNGVENGTPTVKRSILHCNADGQATKIVTDQMNGASKPFCAFSATYKIRS